MPVYEFKCPKCGKVYTELLKYNEIIICECGAECKKVMSIPSKPIIH